MARPPVESLTEGFAPLRTWFNADLDRPRFVAIMSPT